MEDSLRKDVKYLGLKSENDELAVIIDKKLTQRRIIEEITEAGARSISADDVTTCNDEILSICLRYVNNDNEICEVFMEFVELKRITGEAIGNAIIKFFKMTLVLKLLNAEVNVMMALPIYSLREKVQRHMFLKNHRDQ